MNTRLQVEHPVTEAVRIRTCGRTTTRVADGQALPSELEGSVPPVGWAIESASTRRTPRGFLPSTTAGRSRLAGPGDRVLPRERYSSRRGRREAARSVFFMIPMIAKVIATGPTREAAAAPPRTRSALDSFIAGVEHNIGFCRECQS